MSLLVPVILLVIILLWSTLYFLLDAIGTSGQISTGAIVLYVIVSLLFTISIYLQLLRDWKKKREIVYRVPSRGRGTHLEIMIFGFFLGGHLGNPRFFERVGDIMPSLFTMAICYMLIRCLLMAELKSGITKNGIVHEGHFWLWSDIVSSRLDGESGKLLFELDCKGFVNKIKNNKVEFDYNPQDEQTIEALIRRYRDGEDADLSNS